MKPHQVIVPLEQPMHSGGQFTAQTCDRILALRRLLVPLDKCAWAAGIVPQTLATWLRIGQGDPVGSEYRQFYEAMGAAAAQGVAEQQLVINRAGLKDWKAAAWLLERLFPEDFAASVKGDPRVAEAIAARLVEVLKTPEEIKRFADALEAELRQDAPQEGLV